MGAVLETEENAGSVQVWEERKEEAGRGIYEWNLRSLSYSSTDDYDNDNGSRRRVYIGGENAEWT
jgi:hypothetical protein